MTVASTLILTEKFLCWALFLQGLEIFWLCRSSKLLKIWSFQNLRPDFFQGLPLPRKLISFLFADKALLAITVGQVVLAVIGFFVPGLLVFAALFILHLLIVIRFRGSFNGGSDMMIFVVLTGVLISSLSVQEKIQQLGLIYIAIHGVYSYLRAGYTKIIRPEWRSGKALPFFLKNSLFYEVRKISSWLSTKPILCKATCWSVIIFELGIFIIPFSKNFSMVYFAIAILFHLIIYRSFGLNRFFWAWLSAWFAILYVSAPASLSFAMGHSLVVTK